MRLEGSLDAFSLSDILQLLTHTKKSGAFHVVRAAQQGVIRLSDGTLSGASSDTSRQALARRLVDGGHLTDDALAAAVERTSTAPAVGLARALQEEGAVDDAVLLDVATEQAVDAIFDMLRWGEGDFSFEADSADPDDVGLRLSADDVVDQAAERVESWAKLCQQIPSPELVLTLTPAPAGELTLTRDEWALVRLVDGRRSVRELVELVELSDRGEYTMMAALTALVDRGLLEVPGADPTDAATTALRLRQELFARVEVATTQGVRSGQKVAKKVVQRAGGLTVDTTAPAVNVDRAPIEIDPDVNKSMLLKLIAGVRTL